MKNKTSTRIMSKFLISMLVGGMIAIVLLMQRDLGNSNLLREIENILNNYTLLVYLFTWVVLILPTLILQFIGRAAYLKMMSSDEDNIKDIHRNKARLLDISMTLVNIFIACNFLQYGALYHSTTENTSTLLVFFFIGIMVAGALQVSTVKYVQKYNKSLKGDPTKIDFNKNFIGSLEEDLQLKVFKTSHNTLQMMKSLTQILIVISIFMNIIFNTGGFAILISCSFMIMQTITFSIQEQITQ